MLLKYFYDKPLAHASYLVGCQRSGTAIVIDPGRDIDRYLRVASEEGLRIVAVAETHIHADYVSGARAFAETENARLYLSDEGPQEWKYEYARNYDHKLLKQGDLFKVGNLEFKVLHTPGHTPESLSFLLTDVGGGATEPMGIFTGDFIFVGSVGRPDLLEKAAGISNTAEPGARDLFRSIAQFRQLPDFLQVWPAHGAGSACGKELGAIPSSTIGYEKRFNPALRYSDEDSFVDYILEDQPEAPPYFAIMKRVNRIGPEILESQEQISQFPLEEIFSRIETATVIDISPSIQFSQGHVTGTINIPLNMLAAWAGWLVDYSRPVFLIGPRRQVDEAADILQRIGIDDVAGFFDLDSIQSSAIADEIFPNQSPQRVFEQVREGTAQLLDVRSDSEWSQGHIQQAHHCFLGKLSAFVQSNPPGDRPVILHCQSGGRSAIAASLLQAHGYNVINMEGGFQDWIEQGLPHIQSIQSRSCEAMQCPG